MDRAADQSGHSVGNDAVESRSGRAGPTNRPDGNSRPEKKQITFAQIRQQIPYPPKCIPQDEEESSGSSRGSRSGRRSVVQLKTIFISRGDSASSGKEEDQFIKDCTSSPTGFCMRLQQHLYKQIITESPLCDVTLKFGHITMKAHWSVLVSCPFFEGLYNSGMTEAQKGEIHMDVRNAEAMRIAIKYLYTGFINISLDNLQDILEIADYLELDDLTSLCTDFMFDLPLTVDNCVHLTLLAGTYDLCTYDYVFEFFRGHLNEAIHDDAMMNFSVESLMILLQDDLLSYVPRSDFFNLILKWTQHDFADREKEFEALFCQLNLIKMQPRFIEEVVEKCELVKRSKACECHLQAARKQQYAIATDKNGGLLANVILVLGGVNESCISVSTRQDVSTETIYAFDVEENTWTTIAPLPLRMNRPLATFNKDEMVLYSCKAGKEAISMDNNLQLYKFNMNDRLWTDLNVKIPHHYEDVNVENIFYCNETIWLLITRKVVDETSMHERQVILLEVSDDGQSCLSNIDLCEIDTSVSLTSCIADNRFICVMQSGQSHGTVEKWMYLDVHTQTKCSQTGTELGNLTFPVDCELYSINDAQEKVIKYNFKTKKWSSTKLDVPLPTKAISTIHHTSVACNGTVYKIGGQYSNYFNTSRSMSRYDLSTNIWEEMPDLPQPLIYSAAIATNVPAGLVSCNLNCPHCLFQPKYMQAKYSCNDGSNGHILTDDEIYEAEEKLKERRRILTEDWENELAE